MIAKVIKSSRGTDDKPATFRLTLNQVYSKTVETNKSELINLTRKKIRQRKTNI